MRSSVSRVGVVIAVVGGLLLGASPGAVAQEGAADLILRGPVWTGTPEGGWIPQERLDVETALWAYTINNAYAAGMEARKGTIQPGMLAALTVLSEDVTAIPKDATGYLSLLNVAPKILLYRHSSPRAGVYPSVRKDGFRIESGMTECTGSSVDRFSIRGAQLGRVRRKNSDFARGFSELRAGVSKVIGS